MAHLATARADLAAWQAPLSAVTAEEFWQIDENASKAINGDEGGVWAPSDWIIIGGVGLEVSGDFYASNNAQIGASAADTLGVAAVADFTADVTLGASSGDALDVNATATFASSVLFEVDVTIGTSPADSLTVESFTTFVTDVQFDGQTLFSLAAQFDDPVVFNDDVTLGNAAADAISVVGTMTVDEDATFVGLVTAAEFAAPLATFAELAVDILVVPPGGSFVLNEPMTFVTDGRIPWRLFTGGDANEQILVTDGNVIGAALSTGRQYQIDDTGAQNGDWFIFYNDTIYPLDILEPGGTPATLVTDLAQVSGTVPGFAILIRLGGAWKTIGVVSG